MAWRAFNALVNDPQLLVVDARSKSAFQAGHIRGSVCVRVRGKNLEYVSGAVWSDDCWWGKNVLVVPGVWKDKEDRKRKATELVVDPVASFLTQDGHVNSLKILEDDEGRDPFAVFAKRYHFLVTKSCKPGKIPSYPAEIIPRLLYLGTREHATSASMIDELRISYILTVHTDPIDKHEACTHLFFDLADEPTGAVAAYFDQAVEFIEEAKKLKKRVLVHCGAGASRSATLVAYYLMHANQWDVDETIKFLKEQRREVDPNPGFMQALRLRETISSKDLVLEVHKDQEIISRIPIPRNGELLLGRLPTCDVVLDHASISRQHSKLVWSGERLQAVDLSSAHGTFVNKKRLPEGSSAELCIGDVISFGASTRKYTVKKSAGGVPSAGGPAEQSYS